MYCHGVVDHVIDQDVQGRLHMHLNDFEGMVNHLRKRYEVISLDELYDGLSGKTKLHRDMVALTFDDGFRSVHDLVLPRLKALNMPFAVFLSTKHVTDSQFFPSLIASIVMFYCEASSIHLKSIGHSFDLSSGEARRHSRNLFALVTHHLPLEQYQDVILEMISLISQERWIEYRSKFASDRPLNWDEVRVLRDAGVILGSHCHDHAPLHRSQPRAEIRKQLITSKKMIEEHVGPCKYFAYPQGGKDDGSIEAANELKDAGYLMAFTTVPGEVRANMNPYTLPRLGMEETTIESFKNYIDACWRFNKQYDNWAAAAQASRAMG